MNALRPGHCGLLLLLAMVHTGCAAIVANTAASVMDRSTPIVEMEEDPVLAEAVALSNLKLLESMLYLSPRNETLLMMVTKSFGGYAAAFVEPEWSLRDDYFSEEYLQTKNRLLGLFRRSRDTGLRWIDERSSRVGQLLRAQRSDEWLEDLPGALARLGRRDVPALFWTAQAWGLLIRTDDENLVEIANLRKIEMIMQRIYELDPDYNFGSVHLFFGMTIATLGAELGGDLDEAKRHFENAVAVNDGRFLTNSFLYAKEYCRAIQDRDCFVDGLEEVANADPDVFPEQRLANTLATIWARQWLARTDDLF